MCLHESIVRRVHRRSGHVRTLPHIKDMASGTHHQSVLVPQAVVRVMSSETMVPILIVSAYCLKRSQRACAFCSSLMLSIGRLVQALQASCLPLRYSRMECRFGLSTKNQSIVLDSVVLDIRSCTVCSHSAVRALNLSGWQPRSLEVHHFLGTLPDIKAAGIAVPPRRIYRLPGGTEVIKTFHMVAPMDPTPSIPYVCAFHINRIGA